MEDDVYYSIPLDTFHHGACLTAQGSYLVDEQALPWLEKCCVCGQSLGYDPSEDDS